MADDELIKNDMDFTPIHVPAYRIFAKNGKIIEKMPIFKKAIDQGYKIANQYDLTINQMEEYNKDENDRTLLNNNAFLLVGNPIIRGRSGELITINDLEQKIFNSIRTRLLNINDSTYFNMNLAMPLSPNAQAGKELYEQLTIEREEKEIFEMIKTEGKPYITILSSEQVSKFQEDQYAFPELRTQILEGLLHGDIEKRDNFIKHVQKATGSTDISKILGYQLGTFTGIEITYCESVKNGSNIKNISPYSGRGYLLAMGDKMH